MIPGFGRDVRSFFHIYPAPLFHCFPDMLKLLSQQNMVKLIVSLTVLLILVTLLVTMLLFYQSNSYDSLIVSLIYEPLLTISDNWVCLKIG